MHLPTITQYWFSFVDDLMFPRLTALTLLSPISLPVFYCYSIIVVPIFVPSPSCSLNYSDDGSSSLFS